MISNVTKFIDLNNQKFRVRPKPQEDELLSSWLVRVARSHLTHTTSFTNMHFREYKTNIIWQRDLDIWCPDELIERISFKSGYSKDIIFNMTLRSLEGIVANKITGKSNTPNIRALGSYCHIKTKGGLMFCPECLKSKTPYVNKFWRLSWFIICPIHKIELLSNCPKCNHIFAPEKQDYLHPYIYLCCQCKYDLRETELKPINEKLLSFQKKLTNIFANKTINFSFNLLITKSKKDLFLTINILLSFIYKVLRQPVRFNKLIQALELQIQHKFISIHNGTFSRLNSTDRYVLLKIINLFKN